jgi:predicted nucleotidyltransferase component of viral defense system
MISKAFITDWRNIVPWSSNAQVEHDMIISRAVVELFKNDLVSEKLAFRGGTALHKLYISPPARYSEDIDLVQIEPGPIKAIFKAIEKQLEFLESNAMKSTKLSVHNSTILYRYQSEIPPIVTLRLKIEINCREHFTVLGYAKKKYRMMSEWFYGESEATTYVPEELLATKFRALYQRRKGRDLFDLWCALINLDLDRQKIIYCFREYMQFVPGSIPTCKQFELNMIEKINNPEFISDTAGLLRTGIKYDPVTAYEIVKTELIEKI